MYLAQISAVDVKNSQFKVVMNVAYRWTGNETLDFSTNETAHFYKGSINSLALLDEEHVGDQHYQLIRYIVTINKQYWTPRFPLESHQLRLYLEPSDNVGQIILDPVEGESYTNPSLSVSGYKFVRFDTAQTIIADDHHMLNPLYDSYQNDAPIYKSEVMAQIEINRDGWGLYFKCFIALYGTTAWIILCLYLATFRRVDPLGMIGSAFFGAVSNIMVGANLVPDALQVGLLEYVNLFGVALIIAGSAVVISINAIRKERNHDDFARFYGRIMLGVFVAIALVGNIALPLSAYMM